MPTEKQIEANRRNSQHSTGPRTDAGKSISRMNALKSGLHAQSLTIRGEDPAALSQLAAEYNAEFHPTTPRQRDLVDTLVRNEWKIRRLERIEAELWEGEFDYEDNRSFDPNNANDLRRRVLPLRSAFVDIEDRLERLQRRLHAYERSTARALKQLQELRESTTSEPIGFVPSPSVAQASRLAMPAFEPAYPGSSVPAPIGFVPPENRAIPAEPAVEPAVPAIPGTPKLKFPLDNPSKQLNT